MFWMFVSDCDLRMFACVSFMLVCFGISRLGCDQLPSSKKKLFTVLASKCFNFVFREWVCLLFPGFHFVLIFLVFFDVFFELFRHFVSVSRIWELHSFGHLLWMLWELIIIVAVVVIIIITFVIISILKYLNIKLFDKDGPTYFYISGTKRSSDMGPGHLPFAPHDDFETPVAKI